MARTTSRFTTGVFACFTLFLLAGEARACSCVEYGTPPCAEYWRADAVFAGVITDIRKLPNDPNSLPQALLHFRVEDAYRGVSVSELDVATLSGTSCDGTFEKGERWLVYGYRDAATGRLEILPCTRTHLLRGDSEDLAYIRGLKRGKSEQAVLGKLLRNRHEPLAGLKVTVQGGGQSFESMTDAEGGYGFSLPKAGTYTVRSFVPFSAGAMSHRVPVGTQPTDEQTVVEYSVTIPAGQCAYNEIDVYRVDLHATAEVSGTVINEAGEAVTRGQLYLVDAAPQDGSRAEREYTKIGEDGGFKFEGVAVGRYYLVINPDDEAPGEGDAPHPRTFHAGATDTSRATPLVITEGAKLEGITFRVRPAMKARVISGRVVWADGKPATTATVSLYDGEADRYIRMVGVDAEGRFTLEVFGDFKYELSASVYGKKYGASEKVQVPQTGQPAPIKIVVTPKN
jgi:hypothetical protein